MLITGPSICGIDTCQHQACKDAGGCTGTEYRLNHAQAALQRQADALIAEATRWGFVVSIEQIPRKPLAIGSYDSVATVRPARNTEPT